MAPIRDAAGMTIRVPEDQETIQAGINAASPGDSVVVACGTYHEFNIIMRPGIVLRGDSGDRDCVVIDAMQLGRVLICPQGVGLDTKIEGMTLTGGRALVGAGLACVSASPSVINCAFIDNRLVSVRDGGSGAHLFGSSAIFTHCLFADNYGPAMFCEACPSVTVTNSTFYRNLSDVADGSALVLWNSTVTVTNCVMAFSVLGSAVSCLSGAPSMAKLECCNVFGNFSGDWVGCIADQEGQNDNMSVDPLFCDASGMNLRLCADSPCAPENAVECGLIGALPVGCEACAPQALIPSTWGQLKYGIWRPDHKRGE